MKIWNIFNKEDKEVNVQLESEKVVRSYHDYGLSMLDLGLRSQDFGWISNPFKNVTLVNVSQCKEKISVFSLVSAWRGTGHAEWEYLLAGLFVMAVKDAIEANQEEADITLMFSRNFTASDDRVFTRQQVYDHLIDWFDVVSETDDELKIALKLR